MGKKLVCDQTPKNFVHTLNSGRMEIEPGTFSMWGQTSWMVKMNVIDITSNIVIVRGAEKWRTCITCTKMFLLSPENIVVFFFFWPKTDPRQRQRTPWSSTNFAQLIIVKKKCSGFSVWQLFHNFLWLKQNFDIRSTKRVVLKAGHWGSHFKTSSDEWKTGRSGRSIHFQIREYSCIPKSIHLFFYCWDLTWSKQDLKQALNSPKRLLQK